MLSRIAKAVAERGLKRIPYEVLDKLYIPLDRTHIRRTRNIRLIPTEDNRRGGKYSYAEWAHVIGIFQTIIFLSLDNKVGNRILDVGCGTGLLAIACEPFVGENGLYVGIDVSKSDIESCRDHYDLPNFEFIFFDISNPVYAPSQESKRREWPLDGTGFDLVTALSVWTHLNEEDALFYMKEVNRVLKPGGKAIITFFLLDALYRETLQQRSKESAKYHMTAQDEWIFDQSAYDSGAWFCPKWARVPEDAIGITGAGLDRLCSTAQLELIEHHQGNWKEVPGAFFQDVAILKKPLA